MKLAMPLFVSGGVGESISCTMHVYEGDKKKCIVPGTHALKALRESGLSMYTSANGKVRVRRWLASEREHQFSFDGLAFCRLPPGDSHIP